MTCQQNYAFIPIFSLVLPPHSSPSQQLLFLADIRQPILRLRSDSEAISRPKADMAFVGIEGAGTDSKRQRRPPCRGKISQYQPRVVFQS